MNFFYKIKYIIEGFYRLFNKSTDINILNLYKYRYDTCEKCDNFNKKLCRCKICGCFCKAKVSVQYNLDKNGKSINGCPLKKW